MICLKDVMDKTEDNSVCLLLENLFFLQTSSLFFSNILMKSKYKTFQSYEMAFYLQSTNNGEFSAQRAAGGTISQK